MYHFSDKNGFPTFTPISCDGFNHPIDDEYDLCMKVVYPNDNETDYMLLDDGFGFETYKGIMKEEKITVAFNWADEEDGEKNASVSETF